MVIFLNFINLKLYISRASFSCFSSSEIWSLSGILYLVTFKSFKCSFNFNLQLLCSKKIISSQIFSIKFVGYNINQSWNVMIFRYSSLRSLAHFKLQNRMYNKDRKRDNKQSKERKFSLYIFNDLYTRKIFFSND